MAFAGPQFDPVFGLGDAEADYIALFKSYINTLELIGIADLDENDWVALERLFSRPYWKRIWIVQEITNAQVIELYCGSNSISWKSFECIDFNNKTCKDAQFPRAVDRYTTLFGRGATARIQKQRNWTRHWVRSQGYEQNSTQFLNLLERFRDFDCTDPRDKVYALMGLASIDKNMPLPKPDYSKSVGEVYVDTARAIIQYTKDLTILCLPKSYNGVMQYNLPFWCPDWTTRPDDTSMIRDDPNWPAPNAAAETLPQGPDFNFNKENDQLSKKRRPRECGKSLWIMTPREFENFNHISAVCHPVMDIRLINYPKALILKGYTIDRVKEVGKSIPADAFETDEWKKIVFEWEALLDKTVIFGYHGENRNSPEAHKAKLKIFLSTLCRGVIIYPREVGAIQDGIDILYEFYLVWIGRMQPSEAKSPYSVDPQRTVIFEDEILQYLKHWKMALGWEGRLMLVPRDAQEGDHIVILFGSDVPLLLRPSFIITGTGQRFFAQIGTVFAVDIMAGEALYLAKIEDVEVTSFGLC